MPETKACHYAKNELKMEKWLSQVSEITDAERLKYIVRSLPFSDFCAEAVKNPNLKDEDFFEETVLNSMFIDAKLNALVRIKSKNKIENIILNSDDERVVLEAIKRCKDASTLEFAATKSKFASARLSALKNKLMKSNDVFNFALYHDKFNKMWFVAAERITDSEMLSKILLETSYGGAESIGKFFGAA